MYSTLDVWRKQGSEVAKSILSEYGMALASRKAKRRAE